MSGGDRRRCAFLVHPLTSSHRALMAAITGFPGVPTRPMTLCRLALAGRGRQVEVVVVALPLLPSQVIEEPEQTLSLMARALTGGGVDVVGLGSLLGVTAGQGQALQELAWQPVTTGAAATAWTAAANARQALSAMARWPRGPVAVLSYGGTVGRAVATQLRDWGAMEIRVEARGRQADRARADGLSPAPTPAGAARGCPVVVGSAGRGSSLDPGALEEGAVLLDLGLAPANLSGRGAGILAGEAMAPPEGYRRGARGALYHLLAGYGPRHVFACLVEPMLMAMEGLTTPLSQGRALAPADLARFGRLALAHGFRPALVPRWAPAPTRALSWRRP